MADNLSRIRSIEIHSDVYTDWQLLKTNILTIDEQGLPTKRLNVLWRAPGKRLKGISSESPRLRLDQPTKMHRLSITILSISGRVRFGAFFLSRQIKQRTNFVKYLKHASKKNVSLCSKKISHSN